MKFPGPELHFPRHPIRTPIRTLISVWNPETVEDWKLVVQGWKWVSLVLLVCLAVSHARGHSEAMREVDAASAVQRMMQSHATLLP